MNASAARRLAARHTFTALPEHRCACARSRTRHRNAGSLPKLPWPPGRCATVTHLMAVLRRAPAHVLRAPRVLAPCWQWALAACEKSICCWAVNVMSNVLDTVASSAGPRLLPTDRMSAAPRGVRVPWHVMLRVALMYPVWMVASDPHFRLCLRRVRECDVERRPRGRAHSVCVPRRGQWHCGGMPKMLFSKVGFRHNSIGFLLLSCGRKGVRTVEIKMRGDFRKLVH